MAQSKGLVSTLINVYKDAHAVIELEQSLSISTVLECSPIAMQIKEHGRAQVARALDLQLTRLASMMNVKHNLTDSMIHTIVYDLLEKYPHETLEDFLMVFKRMRQGYYGPSYHQLSEASIISCMQMHLEEKYTERERQWRTQKEKDKQEQEHTLSREQVLAAYRRIKDYGLEQQPQKEIDKKEKEYQEWRAQYLAKQILDGNKTQAGAEPNQPGDIDKPGTGDKPTGKG